MIRLVPAVKELREIGGKLTKCAVKFDDSELDSRLVKALNKLPSSEDGAKISINLSGGAGEGYTLSVNTDTIEIEAECERGAFYAIQTLRQIFENETIPCLTIKDYPDFGYRGLYQDITRGKVATVETLKSLIDMAAYHKINVFQIYVEHVYEFVECREINTEADIITAAELRELDAYCKENFIDFQPSLSTFGHMFEILNMEKHRHLRVLKDYKTESCRWIDRHAHHTIAPELDESFELVKSLIDQYMPNFTSEYFNVCCDETFDLKSNYPEDVEVRLYVEFVKKIINYVKSKGKKVMMWADIILKHPEYICELPEDTIFLNWFYRPNPPEDTVAKFKELDKPQIICPGTGSWWRFCEKVDSEEANITEFADFGKKYDAMGVLTTNWGDWGNPASIESASYGIMLGAAKSWAVSTKADEEFHECANELLYRHPKAFGYLREISDAMNVLSWQKFIKAAFNHRDGKEYETPIGRAALEEIQGAYKRIVPALAAEDWTHGDFKGEFINTMTAISVCAELAAKLAGLECERLTDTEEFLNAYGERWLKKNKPSDLWRIEEILRYVENI